MKFQRLFYSSLLWSCCYWTTTVAAPVKKEDPLILNPSFFLKTFLGISQDDSSQQPPQDLMVIGPGFGRTGTSSFITALNRIGLKSYHMSAVMRTPGHLETWIDYIQGDKSADDVINALSAAGFNATSSMPACFLYKELVARYPNARVVLTVRGDGNGMAWAKSVKGSIGLLRPALERIPFRWIPKVKWFKILFHWIFAQRHVYFDENLVFHDEDLANMYNEWVNEVKATVPEEKLLVFAPKDGWKPLCDFLSPLSDEIKDDCKEILASGEPYPHINEKAHIAFIVRILGGISTAFEYGPFVLALVAVLWFTTRNDKKKTKEA